MKKWHSRESLREYGRVFESISAEIAALKSRESDKRQYFEEHHYRRTLSALKQRLAALQLSIEE